MVVIGSHGTVKSREKRVEAAMYNTGEDEAHDGVSGFFGVKMLYRVTEWVILRFGSKVPAASCCVPTKYRKNENAIYR
jgi:hypothetical protein